MKDTECPGGDGSVAVTLQGDLWTPWGGGQTVQPERMNGELPLIRKKTERAGKILVDRKNLQRSKRHLVGEKNL